MNIELTRIKVRDVVEGYQNNQEEGVVGYGGKLDIRPAYQREFVYKDKQRDAVIDTVRKSFPLNIMYWIRHATGNLEVLDGQQRTLSICEYIKGKFAIENQYFFNLTQEEQDQILDYELTVYICEGSEREKLEWFKVVNTAGERLTNQELRNATYSGPFLSDAKRLFSKTNCSAWNISKDYLKGSPIRQDYLETALKWISKDNIEEYMAEHQHKPNAKSLWLYFQSVITWAKETFKHYRKEIKGIDLGALYDTYKDTQLNSDELEVEIQKLMEDEDVTNKPGIFTYVLSRDEKHLNIRQFTERQKREAYERQKGICPVNQKEYPIEEMEADHITPWHLGGKTNTENCQVLSKEANRRKSGK